MKIGASSQAFTRLHSWQWSQTQESLEAVAGLGSERLQIVGMYDLQMSELFQLHAHPVSTLTVAVCRRCVLTRI